MGHFVVVQRQEDFQAIRKYVTRRRASQLEKKTTIPRAQTQDTIIAPNPPTTILLYIYSGVCRKLRLSRTVNGCTGDMQCGGTVGLTRHVCAAVGAIGEEEGTEDATEVYIRYCNLNLFVYFLLVAYLADKLNEGLPI